MTLIIDGVDMIPYLAYRGYKWQRADIDKDAERDLDGDLIRNRINTKRRLDLTCRPLTDFEASIVLTVIMPELVTVTYTDPQLGQDVTKTMYSNNNPASYCQNMGDYNLWEGITFPLIEV